MLLTAELLWGGTLDSHSRSASRSKSPAGSVSTFDCVQVGGKATKSTADSEDWGTETLEISDSDAAFILGKGGRTKEKIARVAGSRMDMSERNGQSRLEIRGTALQRRKTMKYVKCVMAQRVGPVHVDDDDQDDDLTLAEVPTECVGFVTGKQGNFLRTMEDEWGVIMFFAEFKGNRDRAPGGLEKLAMFGPRRGRRGAELKVRRTSSPRLASPAQVGAAHLASAPPGRVSGRGRAEEERRSRQKAKPTFEPLTVRKLVCLVRCCPPSSRRSPGT